MTQKTINCAECKAEFNYEPNPHYRDNRKYCDPCGLDRKVAWEKENKQVETSSKEVVHEKVMSDTEINDMTTKPKSNGFHLTPENIKHNEEESRKWAMELCIKQRGSVDWTIVKEFEQYILTGK